MVYDFIQSIMQSSFFIKYGLVGLFLNALLSSVIPIPTELTTSALILGGQNKMAIFIILTIGSIIGGFLAYYIGYNGTKLSARLGRTPKKEHMERSDVLLTKYGWVLIFFSPWIPILGDIIPIIAGAKKYNIRKFVIAICLGKVIKSLAIVFFSSVILSKFF